MQRIEIRRQQFSPVKAEIHRWAELKVVIGDGLHGRLERGMRLADGTKRTSHMCALGGICRRECFFGTRGYI